MSDQYGLCVRNQAIKVCFNCEWSDNTVLHDDFYALLLSRFFSESYGFQRFHGQRNTTDNEPAEVISAVNEEENC